MSAPASLGRVTAATMVAQLFVMIATLAPGVLAPAAAPELGLAPHMVGALYALQNAGGMLACLSLTGLVRRYGGIRASQIGLLGICAGTAASASGSIAAIACSSIVVGLGMALMTPAAAVLLARSTPANRMNLVFSVRQSVVPVGAAVAGLLVPWLLEMTGWRAALALIAAGGLAFAAAIQPIRGEADRERDRRAPLVHLNLLEPLRAAFSVPALRYVALGGFVFNGAQQLLWIYFVSYLHLELGYTIAAAGAMFAASQAAAVVCRVAWGWLADRLRDPFVVLAGLAAGASACFVLFALLGPDSPRWQVLLVALAFSATAAGWNGVHVAAIVRYSPRDRLAALTGAIQLFPFLAAAVMPTLFALLVSLTGRYSSAYLASCVLPLVFFAALASPRRRRALAAPAVS